MALVIFNLIIFSNSIKNEFVWDDIVLIENNNLIKNTKNLKTLLTKEDASPFSAGTGYYRPLINLTYMLDYQLHGGKPSGYRLTNIAFHILCAIMLFFLALLITKDRTLSLIAALIFSAQAVHVEAVTFISGRNNVVCALFSLISLYYYIKNATENKHYHFNLSLLFLFLAAASKEFAFMLPLIFILYDYSFKPDFSFKKNLKKYVGLFTPVICFLILKAILVPFGNSANLHTPTLFRRLITTLPIMVKYMASQIAPCRLGIYTDMPLIESFFNIKVIGSLVFLILIIALAIKYRKKERLIFFALISYFILLIPVFNIIRIPNAMMADRWLYPASALFAILIARVLSLVCKKNRTIIFIVALLFVSSLSYATIKRNHVFKNNLQLFEDAIKKNPNSAQIENNLGMVYKLAGDLDEAEKHYLLAIENNPNYFIPYSNLGSLYGSKKDNEKALEYFNKAFELEPNDAILANNVAISFMLLGNADASIKYFEIATTLHPELYQSYFYMAEIFYLEERYDEAVDAINTLLKLSENEEDIKQAQRFFRKILAQKFGKHKPKRRAPAPPKETP
ncbi:tetratricopeptide repeat protein [Thermodesulfobacteriota bacterium]